MNGGCSACSRLVATRGQLHTSFAKSGEATQEHSDKRLTEGKRMASGLIRNQVPVYRLRVRVPCPPLRATPRQAWLFCCPS